MKRLFILFIFVLQLSLLRANAAELSTQEKIEQRGKLAVQNAELYYDELFDSEGKLRPQYKDIYPAYLNKSPEQLSLFRQQTLKDFRGDNALSALPRIMTDEEFQTIKDGVAQRGEALLKFLQDHYSGSKTYLEKIIPKEVIDRIIARAGESDFEGKIKPEYIRFMYGPDIIRDAKGVNRVLEDNTSFLGGQGDLVIARESLFRHMPEVKSALPTNQLTDPKTFYTDLLTRYRSELKNPTEKIVVFSIPPYPDKEDYRLKEIWESLGVEWAKPNGPKTLITKSDGVYLKTVTGKKEKLEKVGYVIFNTEFYISDPSFPANRKQLLLKEAMEQLSYKGKEALPASVRTGLQRAITPDAKNGQVDYVKIENILKMNSPYEFNLEKNTVPGLLEAVTTGKVLSNNTPGTEFINDKEFNIYVEDLIRHYLKQEPILRNLPTERLYITDANGNRAVNEAVMANLEKNWDKYVVKTVDGRGGDGVWVGPKLSEPERVALVKRLREDLNRETIIQSYSHPSVLGNDIVDLRVLSQVGYSGTKEKVVYVPNLGWSRAVSMAGDGKVNLSAGSAHEVTFIVAPDSMKHHITHSGDSCELLYRNMIE